MTDEYTLYEISKLARGEPCEIRTEKLAALARDALKLHEDSQKLRDLCAAIGMPVPERPMPNYGSGFAGGSGFEMAKQDEWREAVLRSVREGLRTK
jgi:hypothetical protein